MSEDEAEALQRVAEWRMRKVDENPADAQSAAAARLLEKLAGEMRQLRGSSLAMEYVAICNWLGESEDIADFVDLAHDYRARIGFDHSPATGEAYLQALIGLAKGTFGIG